MLLFSQMTRVLDVVQDFLDLRSFPCLRLDGSTKTEQRYSSLICTVTIPSCSNEAIWPGQMPGGATAAELCVQRAMNTGQTVTQELRSAIQMVTEELKGATTPV